MIAAHANGPNGVITETLRMGTSGQARVAVTQSPYLHALEFINFYTDHEKFTSPGFYNGKTEHYERRMFCIKAVMPIVCAAWLRLTRRRLIATASAIAILRRFCLIAALSH